MKKKIIKIVVPLLLFIIIGTISFSKTNEFVINDETFSFNNKDKQISSKFDSSYNISSDSDLEHEEEKQLLTELTKKTTYLLLGEANKQNESSENYYKRHQDYLKLRYNPEVPKDENSLLGLDENSPEYEDDILSGISVPGMFNILNELDIKYNSYGNIKVSIIDDINSKGTITLTDIQMKKQNEEEPMKYDIIKTDLTIYYFFKKLNSEYKLLYLYAEVDDEIEEYISKSSEKSGELSKDAEYKTNLEDIYDFSKANAITDDTLKKIYNENNSKIVYLNSTYFTGTVTSANGFFLTENIIITTYNYIEKSLMKAQNIIISDNIDNVYELDGIVTMNPENDVAILKVKNKNQNYIKIEELIKKEKADAVISLNTKTGIGLSTSKGILTSIGKELQTSIPIIEDMQGSPLFDSNGKLIGMLNSKSFNTSISYATNLDIISAYYGKLKDKNYEDIKSIPFETLKENYYIKYNDEKVINNIPQNKILDYNNVEGLEEMIKLNLVKSSYKDGIITYRFKNNISNYIDTIQFAAEYRENLKNKGYTEKNISDSKIIYESKKYQIIIMSEFDYLIVVMVKL